jgi:putative ABC transport system ATP-binding protein
MLEVAKLSKSYATPQGPLPVLREVSLALPSGETAALVGESGSGKSTLLHLIAGIDRPDSGTIRLDGAEIATAGDTERARLRRTAIGLIFQQFNLIPSLDVAANLAFQARIADRHDPDWQAELTARLGLADLTDRYPEQLSGGQQQRVAIGRALAGRPGLLLADEPTGNLDEATGDQVMALMLDLVRVSGASLLMVTHSPRLAALMERRIELRAGRIGP